MASVTRTSSEESINAPNIKFNVSSSSEDICKESNNQANPEINIGRKYECSLCCKSHPQRRYHCGSCVRNGNFMHSKITDCTQKENLFEKQQRYIKIKGGLKDLSNQYEMFMRDQRSGENLLCEIKRKKQRIQLLNRLVSEKEMLLNNQKEKKDLLSKANFDKQKQLPRYFHKVESLQFYIIERHDIIHALREQYADMMTRVQQKTRHDINNLVKYIFPISEIMLKDEKRTHPVINDGQEGVQGKTHNKVDDTRRHITNAEHISYIRGKWVFHGSGISEVQYRIVAPSLPANGDYTAFLDWLTDNKDDVPKTEGNQIPPSQISAFRIIAALTYTTQLTEILSYYLNVRLPHKVEYGDFCRKLNAEQFCRKVSRLNSNIMYLAYSQQVQLRNLNENHTLENILAILDVEKSNLGCHGFYAKSNAPLMKSVDSLLKGIETATESESEDENSLRSGWEAVSNIPDEPDIEESDLVPDVAAQQSSITGGIISSAANRITAILRWRR